MRLNAKDTKKKVMKRKFRNSITLFAISAKGSGSLLKIPSWAKNRKVKSVLAKKTSPKNTDSSG